MNTIIRLHWIHRPAFSPLLWLSLALCVTALQRPLIADEKPRFHRGLNLNGPPVRIDGHDWEGQSSADYASRDKAFENQNVPLIPQTDAARALMIRSSRWGGNRLELTNLSPGPYTVFLYVWEDNNAETYSIDVNAQRVLNGYSSGSTGHWERLGPWHTTVGSDRKILLTSQGGAANWSGVELWSGHYDGITESISEEQLAFFEKRIRPLLVTHCYECHSSESAELAAELLLDSRGPLRRGGISGPAVVPGDPAASLLLKTVRYTEADLQMPPAGRLSDAEIRDLELWVQMGAPDPRATSTRHLGKRIDVTEARRFWSLKPLADPPPPPLSNSEWAICDIDRFILQRQQQHGLQPTPQADRRTLLRRATYDLTGLPPTPQEIAEFLADESPQAFATVVDRLLDSPRYGERWGRYWLDVVRYADTAGDNSDYPIPQLHRYRDWVIEALNRDLPYDEFVRDQIAGDLRGGSTDAERDARLIATGYLANARRFGSRVDDYPWHLTIEDTIDNLGRTFLGLSLGCTRCHDHKFDPFTTRDYYGLYGIFSSTRYPWPGIELDKRQRQFVPLVSPELRAETERAQADFIREQTKLADEVKRIRGLLKKASAEMHDQIAGELREAEQRAELHRQQKPRYETAYAVIDATVCGDAAVQIKGDPARPGDLVPRHFPAVLGGTELPADTDGSGRLELAEWILAADNPLPARVMVNRIWQYHFGRGLVATSNDFGHQGKSPTHPELLDWLAVRFRNSGWSVKAMHRSILLSQTWQQSSDRSSQAEEIDPANDWLAGFPRRRLDAEAIRDTLLLLGNNLDLSPAGPHPFPDPETWDFTQHKPFKAIYESNHRSIFLMTQRIQRHPFMAIFDGADPSASTAARMTSTTPLQALYLLNDPFVHSQSELIARRIQDRSADNGDRIRYAFELILARPPDDPELSSSLQFLESAEQLLLQNKQTSSETQGQSWNALTRTLLRLNEFLYLD